MLSSYLNSMRACVRAYVRASVCVCVSFLTLIRSHLIIISEICVRWEKAEISFSLYIGWEIFCETIADPKEKNNHSCLPTLMRLTRVRCYKTNFMLNSADHEILNAQKYKNIKKLSIIPAHISRECYLSCS